MSKKHTPIRTLAEAERWCRENFAVLRLYPHLGRRRWEAKKPGCEQLAPTPWAAVDKLRKKVEGK